MAVRREVPQRRDSQPTRVQRPLVERLGEARVEMVQAIGEVTRVPSSEAHWSRHPGVYVLFVTGGARQKCQTNPLYGRLLRGADPVYAGSASVLAERGDWHVPTLRSVAGLDPNHVWVAMLELPGAHDFALALERTLIALCNPLWNSMLRGFGGRKFGEGRKQATSWFDALHQPVHGREWVRPPSAWEELRSVFGVLDYVVRPVAGVDLWGDLWSPKPPAAPRRPVRRGGIRARRT
jgi:hypothetical protein